GVDFVSAQIPPAMQVGPSRRFPPSGEYRWAKRSSASWSGWPRSARPWPEMCTAVSGRSVPENTRTRLTRPTYGSMVVLTTSATSGPLGSQVSGARGVASRAVTAGGRVPAGVVVHPLRDQADEPGDGLAVVAVQRQVQRQDVVAEHPLALGERLVEVGPLVVQPGHRDGAGHADRRALLPERGRGGV